MTQNNIFLGPLFWQFNLICWKTKIKLQFCNVKLDVLHFLYLLKKISERIIILKFDFGCFDLAIVKKVSFNFLTSKSFSYSKVCNGKILLRYQRFVNFLDFPKKRGNALFLNTIIGALAKRL